MDMYLHVTSISKNGFVSVCD